MPMPRWIARVLVFMLMMMPRIVLSDEGPDFHGWKFTFTTDQVETLRNAGATFDNLDRQMANQMAGRGFTADEFVDAYVRMWNISPGDRFNLDRLATLKYLGYPDEEYRAFKIYGGTVTDYYNSKIGGLGERIAGWVVFGIGTTTAIVGGVFILFARDLAKDDFYFSKRELDDREDTYTYTGIGMAIAGGVLMGVGLPLVLVGRSKTNRWAPHYLLDYGTKEDMASYRLKSEESTHPISVEVQFSPVFFPNGSGIGVMGRF